MVTKGVMSLHAFNEQFRFVKGSAEHSPAAFWKENSEDVVKVTLTHLAASPYRLRLAAQIW